MAGASNEAGIAKQPGQDPLSGAVIGAALEVHRSIGPGLLESAYRRCITWELEQRGIDFAAEVPLPVVYKGNRLDCGYRIDLLVQNQLVVELKAIDRLLPIHEAQLLTYLRLSGKRTGLLINFHTRQLKEGIKRLVL